MALLPRPEKCSFCCFQIRHNRPTCTPAPLCCCRAPPPPAARTAGQRALACSLPAGGRALLAWRGAPHSAWIEGDARPTIVPLPWPQPRPAARALLTSSQTQTGRCRLQLACEAWERASSSSSASSSGQRTSWKLQARRDTWQKKAWFSGLPKTTRAAQLLTACTAQKRQAVSAVTHAMDTSAAGSPLPHLSSAMW